MGDVLKSITDVFQIFSIAPRATTSEELLTPTLFFGLIVIILLILCAFYIYLAITKAAEPVSPNISAVEQKQKERALQLNKKEGFANTNSPGSKSLYSELIQQLPENQRYLVNFQPLTGNLAGYIGEVFSPETYVQKAFRSGIRAFVLPVSVYKDDNKVPPLWPYSKKPAIVARDENGSIISKNGMSIQKFCESLMLYVNENPTQAEEPILLYIVPDGNFVPNSSTEEKEYVQLMSNIAKELKVLDKKRLTNLGQYGSATGGRNESNILVNTPLTELKSKILIFTTFDTGIHLKSSYKNISPTLYEYANFLPQSSSDSKTSTTNSSKYFRLADVIGSKVNWQDQCRSQWCATLTKSDTYMDPFKIDEATRLGVQSIPIDFFSNINMLTDENINKQNEKDMNAVLAQWNGFAWRIKVQDARLTKPAPVQPAKPSQKMNARASANLPPGSLTI